jgi:DNA-binding transcriptional MocR family regulator
MNLEASPAGRLVVLPDSSKGRRALGPVAWATLEALALSAEANDGTAIAYVSARSLAGELGVGKNTAAAALRRLATAGLVRLRPSRRAGGRYAGAGYELDPVACRQFGLVIENASTVATASGSARTRPAPCPHNEDTAGQEPSSPIPPNPVSPFQGHGRPGGRTAATPVPASPQPSLFDSLVPRRQLRHIPMDRSGLFG